MNLPSSLHSVLLAAISLCLASACEDPQARWSATELNESDNYFSSVWGASAEDVFVVGGVGQGVIQHWDGTSWNLQALPSNTPSLIWVFGFAPDDVYAVGERGAFVHYDGSRWSTLDSNTSKTLWGIWGSGPDDLWLVGGEITEGRPTIRRYNGLESEVFEIETSEYAEEAHALFKVWGTGNEVFAVGQRGTLLHYEGDSWQRVDVQPATTRDFIAVWGQSASDMTVVGGRGRGVIARPSSNGFSLSEVDEVGGLAAVYQCGEEIWVGSDSGALGRFSAQDLSIDVEFVANNFIHALWSDCGGTAYAVGGFFQAGPQNAVAIAYE